MRAVDTNILARLILNDDAAQAQVAGAIVAEPFWVTISVWVELGWVLGSRLRLNRNVVADTLTALLAMETLHTAAPDGIAWAIARYRQGADWADLLHLVMARDAADRFATFDRRLAPAAGPAAPLSIETLG